jgi:hypothetical protein
MEIQLPRLAALITASTPESRHEGVVGKEVPGARIVSRPHNN